MADDKSRASKVKSMGTKYAVYIFLMLIFRPINTSSFLGGMVKKNVNC